jgi:hypothetical protein
MRKIILIAFTLMLVGGNISASAAPASGNKILKTCKSTNPVSTGICIGFVVAANQGLTTLLVLSSPTGKMTDICIPKEVTTGQMRDIFIKHLENDPKNRHMKAFILFVEAMRVTYPCPK